MPVTRLDDRGAQQLDALGGVSLTFARPLPVRDVLLLLFRGTRFSLVIDPGVSSTFVGELKDLTLRQALEGVLGPAESDYVLEGTLIRVFPEKPAVRLFSIDHLPVSPAGSDFFADLGAGVESLLSATGRVQVNRKASLIQVTDFAERLELVAAYIEAAQLRVNRQIRLDVRVLEVARAEGRPLDWTAIASRPTAGLRRAASSAGWNIDDVGALLGELGSATEVRQLTAPSVLAMNNEPAVVRVHSTLWELRLAVTSQISAGGIVHMHVSPSYALGRNAAAAGEFTAEIDTVVRVFAGETVVIGGLMRMREDNTPVELVVLLTPTRVTTGVAAAEGGR
jgi:type II secretory pathway component GspD/PulD (secretin)